MRDVSGQRAWDRVFQRKFADPDYYQQRPCRLRAARYEYEATVVV